MTATSRGAAGSGDTLDAHVRLARIRRRMFGKIEPPSIGGFDVLHKLGEGGMGVVYAAWDPSLDRLVALKVLRDRGTDASGVQREAVALARLRHPNVVSVYAVGTHERHAFLAMEYVEGETLRTWAVRWRASGRQMSELVDVFSQVARGLSAAHQAGVVHRDVKPENIMIDAEARVQLMDFGLARLAAAPTESSAQPHRTTSTSTMTTSMAGTPGYIAPEVEAGERPTAAADQYAVAVCIYEVVVGQKPAASDPPLDALPRRLRRLVSRGLSPRPGERWPSMDAFVHQLARTRPRSRRSWVAGAAVVAAAVTTAAFATDEPSRCGDGATQFGEAWGVARQADVLAALGRWQSPDRTQRIVERLDEARAAWLQGHRQTCVATRVTGSQSEEMHDRKMWCLERRRGEIDALTLQLAGLDAAPSDDTATIEAVDHLMPPSVCADDSFVRAEVPPPADAAKRAAAAEIRQEIDTVRAGFAFGVDRREELKALRQRAATLGLVRVEAEVFYWLALHTRDLGGDLQEVRGLLLDALDGGEETGDLSIVASVWIELVFEAGVLRADAEDFAFAARRARIAVARGGNTWNMRWRLALHLGHGATELGRPRDALRHLDAAVSLYEEPGASDSGLWSVLNARSHAYGMLGEHELALADLKRAGRLARGYYGVDARIAQSYQLNVAILLLNQQRYDEAEAELVSVMDTARTAPVDEAQALHIRAVIRRGRGQPESALADAERALELLTRTVGAQSNLTRRLRTLVINLQVHLGQCSDAVPSLDALIAEDSAGLPPQMKATLRVDRAKCLLETDPAKALVDVEEAQRLSDEAGLDDPALSRRLLELSNRASKAASLEDEGEP